MADCQGIIDELSALRHERAELQAEQMLAPPVERIRLYGPAIAKLTRRIGQKQTALDVCQGHGQPGLPAGHVQPGEPGVPATLNTTFAGTLTVATDDPSLTGWMVPLAMNMAFSDPAFGTVVMTHAPISLPFSINWLGLTQCPATVVLTQRQPAAGAFSASLGTLTVPMDLIATVVIAPASGFFNPCHLTVAPAPAALMGTWTTGTLPSSATPGSALSGAPRIVGGPNAGAMKLVSTGRTTGTPVLSFAIIGHGCDLMLQGAFTPSFP
jgi:hypothetical protein